MMVDCMSSFLEFQLSSCHFRYFHAFNSLVMVYEVSFGFQGCWLLRNIYIPSELHEPSLAMGSADERTDSSRLEPEFVNRSKISDA